MSVNHEIAGLGEHQIRHYQRAAGDVEFADLETPNRQRPGLGKTRDLKPPEEQVIWSLSLAEAIHNGLKNSPIIKQNAQFLSTSNSLMDFPDTTPSVFDIMIQDNGVLFGNRGTPAAISDYDPKFTSSVQYGRNATVPNNQYLGGGLPPGATTVFDTVQAQSRLEQTLTTGGTLALLHNWTYEDSNLPGRLFPSAYTGALGMEFRQPLWAGAGKEYTGIAGPLAQRVRGFSPINQGVVIAFLNNKISQIDFENHVQNLVRDIGDLYWDLYLSYHEYEAEAKVKELAHQTWKEVQAKLRAGIEGGGAADEAQAADAYFDAEARTENALSNIYLTETRLRRLIGLTADDGQLIKPCDLPVSEDQRLDQLAHLQEAFDNRVELRRQKTNIESIRLQLCAARSLVNPRVDFTSNYQLNGFGQNLIANTDADGITREGFNSAYTSLFRGSQSTWQVGFEVTVPIFLRAERSQMRQLEFKLAKAQAVLADQENEISHELTFSFQSLQRWLTTKDTNRRRREAARRRVDASRADYEAGRNSLDLLLRAQSSLSQAEVAYHRSLSEYNKTLWDIQFRTGTLLLRNYIQLENILPVAL